MIEAETAVRARRRLTNKLIAGHDAARLKPFFMADAKVIAGDGSLITGAAAILDAFARQFAEPGFVAYVRTTESVAVDEGGERAAERGAWQGTWRGRPGLSGDYLAVWRKVTGQWVIESELYVTLAQGDETP
ncbi:MAG: nuclear transport factor 2 family protein [Proteobacteria bacterium]|nr:nuclear transport factor 2 family protein [Pseudomonadota bacterium]